MSTIAAISVRVTGRVQGVSFRAWTKAEAEALGLSGWVRNEADGSVFMQLAGAPEALDRMQARLWQGPPAARVSDVVVAAAEPDGDAAGVRITG